MNQLKNEKAEEKKWEAIVQRARRECATAGNIDRCIEIKTGQDDNRPLFPGSQK